MTDTMYNGYTKREFLALQMFEAGCSPDAADGALTASEERVAKLWPEYVGDSCPFCHGTREQRTARGLHESPGDALTVCPWCGTPEHEAVNEPSPF